MITARDDAIDTICSNLFMSGCLLKEEYAVYMAALHQDYDNAMLAQSLIESRRLLDMSLEMTVVRNKN